MSTTAIDVMAGEQKFEAAKLSEIKSIATTYNYAPIKVALCFGFLTRKNYVQFLAAKGYEFVDVRTTEIDDQYLNQCDIHQLNSFLYLPLKKDGMVFRSNYVDPNEFYNQLPTIIVIWQLFMRWL